MDRIGRRQSMALIGRWLAGAGFAGVAAGCSDRSPAGGSARVDEQGAALVERVIARVHERGLQALGGRGAPRGLRAEQLDGLRLPTGAPPSPAMHAWLAFDASFLGWFDDLETPTFHGEPVGALALRAYGADNPLASSFGALQAHGLPGSCLLVPGGGESRRFLYLSEPDDRGEYPVLLIDIDDTPFVCVQYPGLDVYLATLCGLCSPPARVYGSYARDPRYAARMAHHIGHALGGDAMIEMWSDKFPGEDTRDSDPG